MAMLISLVSFAQDAPVYELYPVSGSNNSYAGNCDVTVNGIKWNLTGNSTMDPWRIGGKSITNVDRALYSKTPLAYNIAKIEVTHGTASSITVNSFKLIISDEANGAGETIDVAFKASATTTIDLPEGDYTNKYFKFLYNVTVSGSSNKFVQFVGAKFYAALAEDAVKAPIIKGAEDFISETEVTIEAEDDVTVYYTLDGTEPTTASTVYTAPFTVKETTTVKAVAYRGETASFVTSATFTQATRVTAAEAAQLAMKVASNNALTSVTYVIDAYVTSVIDQSLSSGQQRFWVADTKNGGQVLQSYYCNVPRVLKVGDYIQMFGKLTKYDTNPQMKNGDVTILPEPVVNYNITVSANPAEGGVVTGGGEFEETDEITVKAVANENYAFVNWTENDVEVSTAAEYTFEVLDDRDLVANFQLIPCTQATPVKWTETIALEANADKWYLVDIAEAVAAEKDLTLTINNTSEEDVELTIDSYTTCPTDELDRVLASTKTIKAGETFVKDVNFVKYLQGLVDQVYLHVTTVGGAIEVKAETAKFNVTATAENGTVEGAGIYEQGAEATLTATAAEGYEFVNWTSGETVVSTENPYKFTVTADVALVANFKKTAPAKLYLTPNANWKQSNARFAAYFFGNGETWVSMTKVAGETSLYEVTIPTNKKYPNVIFCRMNPSASANNWNNKWNQTGDLVIPTDGKNHYTVKENTWDKGGGTWSIWPVPTVKTYVDITITVIANAPASIKWANAGDKLADATEYVAMTAGENNTYTYTLAQVDEAKGVDYTVKVGDIVSTTQNTSKNVTVDFKNLLPQVAVEGIDGKWDSSNKMTVSDDYLTASITLPLAAKDHAWKLTIDAAWLGGSKFVITRTNNSVVVKEDAGGDGKLTADIAGDYVFTWTYASQTLTVTYPALPVKYNVTVTAENGTVTGAGEYTEGTEATLVATANEGYEFVNWTVGEEVVSTENPYSFVVTADVALVANFKEVEPEIEWIPMDLEITNLTTEVLEVEGAKYLQLAGRDDMNDADVMLFLNNYADVDDDYTVNAESSFMTFGGSELTVLEGVIAQVSETDKGTIYEGTVRTYAAEEDMYVEFALLMYAAPATVIELTDAIVAINEDLATLTFNVPTEEGGYYAELAGYTAPGVHEGPQICLFMTPDAVAYTNYAETSVADGIITLKGEFVSPMGPKFDVTISGKLPEVEKPELPAASVRAWAYDLALAVEGEQYTFSYKATTAALATLILTDAEGVELATKDLGLVEAGANTAVLAADELPAGQKVNWAVKLEAGAIANIVEVTDQSRGIYDFYNMMDVLVDNNPESEYFGKIYIQMALDGRTDGSTERADTQKAGLFIYDQELNELNDPSNVGIKPTLPEGYTMGDDRNKFHRLEIDPKTGKLAYCYNVAGSPAVFAIDRANLTGEVENLIAGVEGLNQTCALAFDAEGTLYLMNLANSAGAVYKIVDGQAVAMFEPTGKFINASMSMAADGMGGLWIAQNRGQIDVYYQLAHVTKDGVLDYTVFNGSNPDNLTGSSTRGALTYDAERQLLAQGRNGKVEVYSVVYDAETGVPALTLVATTPSVGNNIDGLAFDYAGDLYVVNSTKEKFQKFAMPTETNVCTTPAAAKYAFELAASEPQVEVMELTMTNLQVTNYGEATGLWASDMDNGIEVMLFLDAEGNLMAESSIMVGWMDYTVTGTVTKAYNEELATDVYTAELYTTVGETNYKLIITMYSAPVEATVVVVENAEIDDQTEETGFMYMTGVWTDAEGVVYPVKAEVPGFDATVAEAVYKNVTVTVGGWGDEDPWLGFVQGDATITVVDNVVTLTGTMSSWDGLTLDVTITGTLPAVAEPVEMVGVVKRAVQNGDEVIVLTHEADGAAHIYRVVDGVAVAEISQEGVVPVDPENKGSYLAISDIAVTEDGKLVANNYVRNQFAGTTPEAGYKVGTSYYYIWNDLAAAPAVWFTTQTTARSSHGDVGISFALKGTSTNAQVLTTAVHNNNRAVRLAKYNIIDGQYVEPNIPGGEQSNDYYEYYGLHTTAAYYKEATQGKQFQLSASPLGEGRWFMDGELVNPSEFVLPAVGEAYEASAVLTEDLGNVYNGATYVTVGEQVLMVAPFANPDGQLVGVEILNITNGLEAAQYVDMVYVDEAVAATAAATAVEVVEGGLNITLVADNTIQTWFVELNAGSDWEVYEDEITNLVIDLDNLVLIGGPSSAFQVDVYLGLGDYNRNDGTYQLLPESSIAVMGQDATFIEGYAYEVDAFTPSAKAVVRCEYNGMKLEFRLTMTAAPLEATVVVVEDAVVEIEKYLLWGDMYDYSLKMSGNWINPEDGRTYPVLVEVPVYYPEATEPSEIMSTVTVGGWGDNDPWLGFGEGTLTVTTVDGVVTATGIVQNPMAGVAIDITISGKLPVEPVKYTVTATVNPAEAGTVAGAGEYEENAEATLIATAAEGYEFVNWTVAGEEVSTDATYTFTVTADVEVVANFKAKVGTGVTNIQTGAKAVKTIKNGQLIINRDGKEYNAQGAQLK